MGTLILSSTNKTGKCRPQASAKVHGQAWEIPNHQIECNPRWPTGEATCLCIPLVLQGARGNWRVPRSSCHRDLWACQGRVGQYFWQWKTGMYSLIISHRLRCGTDGGDSSTWPKQKKTDNATSQNTVTPTVKIPISSKRAVANRRLKRLICKSL